MKLSKFKFDLPINQIAKYPKTERDESRLMVIHRDTGKIEHKIFKDIIDYFDEDDCLVINDTKVFPARLSGNKEKTGAKIEVTLLRPLGEDSHLWDVNVDPARKIRVGNKIYFGDELLVAEVVDNTTSRGRTISFHFDGTKEEFYDLIDHIGQMPLPEHIAREVEPEDYERYQTIYASEKGAVTAHSAGLHFTKHLIKRLEIKGINIMPVTLHMGVGNCRCVDVEDLSKFKMDVENYIVKQPTVEEVNKTLANNKKVIAVGISTMKALESSTTVDSKLKSIDNGWTNTFIFPPYNFKVCNTLITNFHLPSSTMLMSACAFGGYDLVMKAYATAIEEDYQFFNYGDAMLIL